MDSFWNNLHTEGDSLLIGDILTPAAMSLSKLTYLTPNAGELLKRITKWIIADIEFGVVMFQIFLFWC
jgi:hypothetical protein